MFFLCVCGILSYLIPQHTLCFCNFQSFILGFLPLRQGLTLLAHFLELTIQLGLASYSKQLPPLYCKFYGHTSHHAQFLIAFSLLKPLSSCCFAPSQIYCILAICISTILSVTVIYFDVTFFTFMLFIQKILLWLTIELFGHLLLGEKVLVLPSLCLLHFSSALIIVLIFTLHFYQFTFALFFFLRQIVCSYGWLGMQKDWPASFS